MSSVSTLPSVHPPFVRMNAALTIPRHTPLAIDRILFQSAMVIALLLVNKAGNAGSVVFFTVLIGMVCVSSEMAFKALAITFLGLVCNQAIVPKTPVWTIGRLLIPSLCLVHLSLDMLRMKTSLLGRSYYRWLLVFLCVAAVLSVATGYYVHIALLKLLSFAIAGTAFFSALELFKRRRRDLAEWFVIMAMVVVVLGLGSIATGIGYNMRGRGTSASTFNGPFYHSNTLGPISALMVVFLACVVVFGRYRNRWVCVGLSGCLVYFIALTGSRTALGSMVVGLMSMIALSLFLTRRRWTRLWMNYSRPALVATVVAIGIGLLLLDVATGQAVTRAAVTFANKGGRSETIKLEQILASRQAIVDLSWRNFCASPLIGIGFEVATTQYFQQNATIFNAPIEKGFLPVAILEETGIIGTCFFVIFLVSLIASLFKDLNIPGLAVFLTFLAVNCGEAMFFSMGGHGAFGWVWCMGGMMLGDFCIVQTRKPPAREFRAA